MLKAYYDRNKSDIADLVPHSAVGAVIDNDVRECEEEPADAFCNNIVARLENSVILKSMSEKLNRLSSEQQQDILIILKEN